MGTKFEIDVLRLVVVRYLICSTRSLGKVESKPFPFVAVYCLSYFWHC